MLRKTLFVLFVALAPLISILAQENVLLEPLSKVEEANARQINDYFIRYHTYFAVRHRLVKVNLELLEAEGEIVVPLFDGQKLVLRSSEITINEFSGGSSWEGHLVQDKLTEEMILAQVSSNGLTRVSNIRVARALLQASTAIKISISLYERGQKSGANLNPVYGHAEVFSSNKPNRYAARHTNPDYVLGVSANFRDIASGSTYRLAMLGMGGPYHVLYEIDPSKNFMSTNDVVGPNGAPAAELTVEEHQHENELQQKRQAFLEELGENPHNALYRETMKDKGLLK